MKRLIWLLVCVSVLVFSMVGVVFANFTYSSVTCPAGWDGTNVECTISDVVLTGADKTVCIEYTFDGGGGGGPTECTDGGTGTWTCEIPTALHPDDVVNWDISAYKTPGTCGDKQSQGVVGSFDTGPNAITLTNLNASGGFGVPAWVAVVGLAALAAAVVGGLVLARRRAM